MTEFDRFLNFVGWIIVIISIYNGVKFIFNWIIGG